MTMSCSLNEKNIRKMIAPRTVLTEMVEKKIINLQGKSEDPGVFPVFVAVNNKNIFMVNELVLILIFIHPPMHKHFHTSTIYLTVTHQDRSSQGLNL